MDDIGLSMMKFGVGQPVSRKEDPTLLRGEGRYTDDINLPGQAYAVMVRSKIAHGVLKNIDISAARAMPGVLAILTHADLDAAGFGPLTCPLNIPDRHGKPMKTPPRPSLAKGKVRYVGEAVACVVAETAVQAKNAAEAVELEIDDLPAVTTPADALAEGAPVIHDEAPGNLVLDFHYGDGEAVKKAFADAAHVTTLKIDSNRVVCNPMEPRSAIGSYDTRSERWILNVGCQGVFGLRGGLASVLKVTPDKLRVLTGNVGGSFGMKAPPYPEYAPLLLAGKMLGRPVKWTDERSESFLSDHHGRDHQRTAELALDKDGQFLAVRASPATATQARTSIRRCRPRPTR
jgi:aerobic carbon-monoxide dehydrogenase large subunit